MAQVGPGTFVTIEYEAFLDSGTKVLGTNNDPPLVFRFGSGEVFPKLEQEIAGLNPGDTREFVLRPEEAFGPFDESKVIKVPLEEFPKGKKLKKGTVLKIETKDGEESLCFVGDIRRDHFLLDFNHPLAGKTLNYRVKILEVHPIT
ncbi:MAG: FKBP-type peptidyl-prolyl cis-trans isomerase [Deltaproteobacteria bacterium]|nr:FKBP-type peptidyl-prolyl cis-trans isomerase [Deltaproteobacteria bacterium]MBW2069637.1 FKBP-type peptidyl-prolyl cis-trans isomerase [Deltaproteobacteria bacterium]